LTAPGKKTRCFAFIGAHLCCRRLSRLILALLKLARVAPARAISDKNFGEA
jgi:hypothetical protein